MTTPARDALLLETFVSLADTLVADYDVVDMLDVLVERCAVIFDATEVGVILVDAGGRLEVVASTSERTRLVEALQLSAAEGPCTEAIERGVVVTADDPEAIASRWPVFAALYDELGFRAVHAIPLRLRDETIGSVNFFRDHPGLLSESDARTAQALADIATIGILHERIVRQGDLVRAQLQHALDSRVVVEQAKGVVAHTHGVGMEEAFALLRDHARSQRARLTEVAQAVVDGRLRL